MENNKPVPQGDDEGLVKDLSPYWREEVRRGMGKWLDVKALLKDQCDLTLSLLPKRDDEGLTEVNTLIIKGSEHPEERIPIWKPKPNGDLSRQERLDRPDREKIAEWLIARRRKLQEKKERHLAKKPQDKQGAMLCGIKARALQEVINYLQSFEPLGLENKVIEIIASTLSENDVRPRAKEILALFDEEEIRKSERERILAHLCTKGLAYYANKGNWLVELRQSLKGE